MIPVQDQSIRDYLGTLTAPQAELVLAIRDIVLAADSRVKEAIKWGSIAFFHQKNICGFRVAKTHVTLVFMEGASINDTHQLLAGTGTKTRAYKIKDVGEVHSQALKEYVRACLAMGM